MFWYFYYDIFYYDTFKAKNEEKTIVIFAS